MVSGRMDRNSGEGLQCSGWMAHLNPSFQSLLGYYLAGLGEEKFTAVIKLLPTQTSPFLVVSCWGPQRKSRRTSSDSAQLKQDSSPMRRTLHELMVCEPAGTPVAFQVGSPPEPPPLIKA